MPAGAGLIAVAIFLAYLPAISGGFIMDDDLLLTNNSLVQAPDGLYRLWCTTESTDYWPLTYATFWNEWRLWGLNSQAYHVTNLILHFAESLLIWVVLRKLSIPGAFLAALIFAVHPVNVESAAWIAQRKNLMAMLFFLLSILWYLKSFVGSPGSRTWAALRQEAEGKSRNLARTTPDLVPPVQEPVLPTRSSSLWYWLSLAAFVLAILGKGSVVVLPALVLGIVWWLRPLTRWDLLRIAPFFIIALALTGVNIWFQTHVTGEAIRNAGFTERLLGAGAVVWFYLYKALVPLNLLFVYVQWRIQPDDPLWWLPLLTAGLVTALLWRYRKSWSRPLLFAWGFFCVSLLPVLGFVDVYFMKFSMVADHYQHIALIGVIALVAAGFGAWHRQTTGNMRRASTLVALAMAGTLALLTWRQNDLYRDAFTLYGYTLEKNPQCWMAENNLGLALLQAGQPQKAIEHLQRALQIRPDYPDAHINMGVALLQIGRLQDAVDHYRQAVRMRPESVDDRINLGVALVRAGRPREAVENYSKALKLDATDPVLLFNMGFALVQTGRIQEAIDYFRQAVALKPDYFRAYSNLGNALMQVDRPQEAVEIYQKALSLKPDSISEHINLGVALVQAGRAKEALEHYNRALALRPDSATIYSNLALAYAQMHETSQALAAARKAIELARSQGQTVQARQIEDWLISYRAGLSDVPNATPPAKAESPPP
jgi:protein O-mannosyl-transferase